MRKPPTGEPCAGKPLARFGGRGDASLPDPYRLQRTEEAVRELAEATRLAPEASRFAYVYAVALHSTPRKREALEVLDRALVHHPGEREMLLAAVSFSRDIGDRTAALKYAERLAAQAPWDPAGQQILQELRSHNSRSER
ncbi:MAG: hypothetical protein ACREV4_15710 [Gammaproteobacteria bacterium]